MDRAGAPHPDPPGEVLRTQLVAPPPRPHALARAHLVDRLRAVSAPGRLTLVAAGAGWGKTTLVGAPGTSTTTDVVPALLDELATLDAPVTLVVDDYHLADSPEIHSGVGFLAAHLPATLRLVLVSRTLPPLPLARLRGQGRVAELGTEDLRLSAAESAELLDVEGAVTGTAWTPDDAARLHARTEGWVIGVHLGVLSRRGHPDAPSPRPSPVPSGTGAGPTRHLVDYLRRDVLDPLPDELRDVLRRTAVLDAFHADLAAAVTGRPDAPALLARAEREQLFVVPLDDRGGWYRFHHLFTDVLRDDLARAEPGLVPQLHARAARWLADHQRSGEVGSMPARRSCRRPRQVVPGDPPWPVPAQRPGARSTRATDAPGTRR